MKGIIVIQAFIGWIYCKDNFTINFITSFIESEGRPTHLVYNSLCWGKKQEVALVHEVSKSGIRCSSSLAVKSMFQDHNVLFLVDLTCRESSNLLLNATSERLLQSPFRWLILSAKDVDPINTTLWSCPVLTDSELVLAENIGDKYILTELYKPAVNQSMLSLRRGFYNGRLVDTRLHKELYRRRKDLMGHPLTMSIVIQENNSTKEHIRNEDILELQHDAAAKLCWIAGKLAYEMLNVTPQYTFSYRWGYKVNGQWSGMISDIESNKADMGTNCYMFHVRMEVAAFTDMVAPLRMRFVFRQPPLAYVSNIFSLPFSGSVWSALAACVAASTVTLYLTSKWETAWESSPSQLDGSIGDALLLTLSAVAQQGCFIEPRRASALLIALYAAYPTPMYFAGRIMEWFLFAALMALYAAYSANIVVLLQAPSNSIRTLAQLADSKIITLAANDVDYSRFVFSPYKDPTHVKIYRRIIPENGKPEFYSIKDGVERIRQGLFAYHSVVEPVYRRIEETFLETEKCDLSEVDFINGFDAFTPVKKDSPYLEVIRNVYKQIREAGLQSALIKRIQVSKPRCSDKVSSFSSVGLLDLRPVLIFMMYGAALATLLLLAEILYSKHNSFICHHCKKCNKTHRRN